MTPNTKWAYCLFLIIFMDVTCTTPTFAGYYYTRLDIVSENNRIVDTQLLMVPVEDEFRVQRLQTIPVTGRAKIADTEDIRKSAKQAAIIELLITNGLQSIVGNSGSVNGQMVTDCVRMRYEGVIKHPLRIQSEGYSIDNAAYLMNTEITFGAIAFPTEWRLLYLKKCISETFSELYFFFKGRSLFTSFP